MNKLLILKIINLFNLILLKKLNNKKILSKNIIFYIKIKKILKIKKITKIINLI